MKFNLGKSRNNLIDSLRLYSQYGLTFGNADSFQLTPDKPNSARMNIPLNFDRIPLGDLVVIVFKSGDGTGDQSRYSFESLSVPQEFFFKDKPFRVFPRSKHGLVYEGFFPLFSTDNDGRVIYGVNSLEELSIENIPNSHRVSLKKAWTLGYDSNLFNFCLRNRLSTSKPTINFTAKNLGENQFGNPHSVFYNQDISCTAVQVAGFLQIPFETDASREFSKLWKIPNAVVKD